MKRLLPLCAAVVLLAGCTASAPDPTPEATPPTPTPTVGVPMLPSGTPADVATGLSAPWSVLRVSDDLTLISQRDDGAVLRLDATGLTTVGIVPDVAAGGEGGLLGLAFLEQADGIWLYAYLTTATDNRIVRMEYGGAPASVLGTPEVVLAGVAKAGNHNGGRIAFGPDGMLYATVGDAGEPALAQDPASPNGKILRMTPEGDIPDDNPTPGSYVYSMGHRNPQGLAWDADGQLWAAEFGQNTWDEFNRIEPGGNYGWPVVEGQGGVDGYLDPVLQWPTSEASPSGLAYVAGRFYLAALRGQRLWAIEIAGGGATATPYYVGEYGRIRDVVGGPGDTLWFLTNNTDGRGDPRDGDDRLLQVDLAPAA